MNFCAPLFRLHPSPRRALFLDITEKPWIDGQAHGEKVVDERSRPTTGFTARRFVGARQTNLLFEVRLVLIAPLLDTAVSRRVHAHARANELSVGGAIRGRQIPGNEECKIKYPASTTTYVNANDAIPNAFMHRAPWTDRPLNMHHYWILSGPRGGEGNITREYSVSRTTVAAITRKQLSSLS